MTESDHQEIQVCYKHPDRPTLLRCNQCDRPICLECAVSTPTGYRCKECVKNQQKRFNTSIKRDYVLAALISAVIGLLGTFLQTVFGMFPFFLTILLGPALGVLIVRLVRLATGKRRSQTLNKITVIAAGIGAAIPVLQTALIVLKSIFLGQFSMLLASSMSLGWNALYIALLCGTIWSNLKGIHLNRF